MERGAGRLHPGADDAATAPFYSLGMRVFRPDDASGPPGIQLLRDAAADRRGRPLRAWPLFALGLIFVSGVIGTPAPALSGEGLVTLLGAGTILVLIATELLFDPQGHRSVVAFCLALGAASIALATVQPAGTAVLGTYAAVAAAVIRLPRRLALAAIVPIVLTVNLLVAIWGSERLLTLAWTDTAFVFMFLIGHLVRLGEQQHAQAQELLDVEERTREARNEAAALAERGRIAREMHDVLAHSLSALAVELEGARLLALDRDADPAVIAAIGRAHRHATSGLGEARAAIETLRGDAVPGPERLGELVEGFAAHGVECSLRVAGEPRPLPSEAALAIYRTAQEALTNVRRHAAAADRVELRLEYGAAETALTVENSAAGAGAAAVPPAPALAAAGSGYGVSGMRERAELIGGSLSAGPTAAGYRVELRVPA